MGLIALGNQITNVAMPDEKNPELQRKYRYWTMECVEDEPGRTRCGEDGLT